MSERKRLTPEQIEKQVNAVNQIKGFTEQIKALLPELEGKACHDAYENSVKNLETKNEKFANVSFPITDEEKEMLRKIRNGEMQVSEVSTTDNSESGNESIEPEKKRKRNN